MSLRTIRILSCIVALLLCASCAKEDMITTGEIAVEGLTYEGLNLAYQKAPDTAKLAATILDDVVKNDLLAWAKGNPLVPPSELIVFIKSKLEAKLTAINPALTVGLEMALAGLFNMPAMQPPSGSSVLNQTQLANLIGFLNAIESGDQLFIAALPTGKAALPATALAAKLQLGVNQNALYKKLSKS